jgi:hypothetical protein
MDGAGVSVEVSTGVAVARLIDFVPERIRVPERIGVNEQLLTGVTETQTCAIKTSAQSRTTFEIPKVTNAFVGNGESPKKQSLKMNPVSPTKCLPLANVLFAITLSLITIRVNPPNLSNIPS